jgi:hypothetical protein
MGSAYTILIRKPEQYILLGGLSAGTIEILSFIFEKRHKAMNWVHLAEGMVRTGFF